MNKLVCYGCSITYGEGLSDCWNKELKSPLDYPSKLSWPAILSHKLKCDYENRSVSGISNKAISHKILNTDFSSDETVVILWTFFERSCILENILDSIRIIPTDGNNTNFTLRTRSINKTYYSSFFTEYDVMFQNFTFMNHTRDFLCRKNIKNYHFIIDANKIYPIPKWNTMDINYIQINWKLPKALDDHHPGELAHIDIASQMQKIIKA